MLKKIWSTINQSIKYRLFFYLILISVVPLSILQVANVIISNSSVKDILVESAEVEVESVLANMEHIMANVEAVCDSVENNVSFQQWMRASYSSMAECYSAELEASMDLASIIRPHTNIYGIYLLGNNKLCCKSTTDSFIRPDFREDEWFENALHKGEITWYGLHDNSYVVKTTGRKFFSCIVPYVDKATAKMNGVIVVDIEEAAFTSLVNRGMAQNGFFFLMDENREVFYNTQSEFVTEEMLENAVNSVSESLVKQNGEESMVVLSGSQSVIVYQKSATTNWTLVGVMPLNYITQSLQSIIWMMLGILIMVVFLAVVISSFLARHFTEPVIDLKKAMKCVEKGDLSVAIEPRGVDEIAELSGSFNHMVVQIRRMTDSIYEKQELLRKSEFKALQAQINPHFLYNSLDSIVWLLRMERTDEAIMILQNLTILFRIFLSKGREVIPIRQEIRHLESYLIIQSMRYSRKFTYSVDVPKEYHHFYTLKLILQPLVENSIYHGLSEEHTNIHIHISLKEKENHFVFSVEDTGGGMTPEELEYLREGIQVGVREEDILHSMEKEGGYGLKNVNERIKIYFGEEYGLYVDSQKNVGTVVTVALPKIEEYGN